MLVFGTSQKYSFCSKCTYTSLVWRDCFRYIVTCIAIGMSFIYFHAILKFSYPLSTLPEHIYSTILSYAKITCKTHTHNPKKLVSIPLTLVTSLANYHSLYSPPSLGVLSSLTQACHSSFWRLTEWYSMCRPPYFCAFAFGHGVKVTGVYHASFYWRHSGIDILLLLAKRSAVILFFFFS